MLLVPWTVALARAAAMALAFPKTNLVVLAPVGAIGLFWAWFGATPKRAFWIGLAAGTVFFTITYSWFGETAGALIAPFGFFLTLGPAVGDAFFGFALVGALVAFAAQRSARPVAPLAGAAVFAFGEWFRSEGLGELGVPFGSLGYTQVGSPFAPLAAYVGTYGVTFVLCVLAAYAAYAIRLRTLRGSLGTAAIAYGAVLALTALGWALWPARAAETAKFRVAAIQGNIKQATKWSPEAFARALDRYQTLTVRAAASRPRLIVWPETVITAALNRSPWLTAQFSKLAKSTRAELVVGTLAIIDGKDYNVLYFFRPDGSLDSIYRKRRLVPFAEHVPFARFVGWIPWAKQASNFGTGDASGIAEANGMRFAPIICWESAFSGLVVDDVRDGADALIVATDDAWFGTTAGPYQHAQIAQLRAIETGRWVVRAAATGISGIIAPSGRYTLRSQLDEETIIEGEIGAPQPTVYDALGPEPVALGLGALYLVAVAWGAGRRRSV